MQYGTVSVCAVRDDADRDGVCIRLISGDLGDFEAFYDGLPESPVFRVLARWAGAIVFADGDIHADDPVRFGIEAIDALERVGGHLRGLDAEEIRVDSTGGLLLVPWYRAKPEGSVLDGLAGFLRASSPAGRDPRIDEAIAALADPAPEVRRTARAVLAGSRPAASLTRTGELKLTKVPGTRPPEAIHDRPPPRAAVLIPPDVLRELGPRERSAAAGIAGVPLAVLDGLAAGGLPLVLESHGRGRDARHSAERIRRATGLPAEASTGGSIVAAAWSASLAATAAATGFAAFTLSLVGLWWLPTFGFLLALGLAGMSLRTGYMWYSQRNLLADAQQAEIEATQERRRRFADPALARAWSALSDARTSLAAAGLPLAPAGDVRAVLAAAEREIEALGREHDALRGSSSTTAADLEARLASLGDDEASHARRARLESTLADVLAMEERRKRVADDAASLESVLAEVRAAIGRWDADDAPEQALDGILAAAKRVQARRAE